MDDELDEVSLGWSRRRVVVGATVMIALLLAAVVANRSSNDANHAAPTTSSPTTSPPATSQQTTVPTGFTVEIAAAGDHLVDFSPDPRLGPGNRVYVGVLNDSRLTVYVVRPDIGTVDATVVSPWAGPPTLTADVAGQVLVTGAGVVVISTDHSASQIASHGQSRPATEAGFAWLLTRASTSFSLDRLDVAAGTSTRWADVAFGFDFAGDDGGGGVLLTSNADSATYRIATPGQPAVRLSDDRVIAANAVGLLLDECAGERCRLSWSNEGDSSPNPSASRRFTISEHRRSSVPTSAISPTGTRLAYVTAKTEDPIEPGVAQAVAIVDLASGETRVWAMPAGPPPSLAWSPDGTALVIAIGSQLMVTDGSVRPAPLGRLSANVVETAVAVGRNAAE